MKAPKILTRELITTHKNMAGYLPIGRVVQETIEGVAFNSDRIMFLCLIADLLREKFSVRFCYLEIGVAAGASMCAISFHQKKSSIEKYAGIDTFDDSPRSEESGPSHCGIEIADRNIRYFGLGTNFALFQGNSVAKSVRDRALRYLRHDIHLLYIDGDRRAEGALTDFSIYGKAVVPGGVVIFNDYHNNDFKGLTDMIDKLDKTGWNVMGELAPNVPTMYVMQKEETEDADGDGIKQG